MLLILYAFEGQPRDILKIVKQHETDKRKSKPNCGENDLVYFNFIFNCYACITYRYRQV